MSAADDAYLRRFYDDGNSRRFSYDHFKRTHTELLTGISESWPTKELGTEYGQPDHLTRACFEADVHRFGYEKTQYQVLRLNQLVKDSRNFEGFQTEAAKLLTALNVHKLRAEYNNARATSAGTARALEATTGTADPRNNARFARYKATQDGKTRPYHASLHNRVFDLAQPGWQAFIPPLGWSCRCQMVYEDDHAGPVVTPAEAEDLLSADEVTRLRKDGFLLDRLDKKQLFSQKQSYLNGLPEANDPALQIGKRKYYEQGQARFADLDRTALPAVNLPDADRHQALADFKGDDKKRTVRVLTDYAQRPLFLTKKDLLGHLNNKDIAPGEDRQKVYFKLNDILQDPDEVYFYDDSEEAEAGVPGTQNAKLTYVYLKFYRDETLATVVLWDKKQPQQIKTWYPVKQGQEDERRRGLLVHKK